MKTSKQVLLALVAALALGACGGNSSGGGPSYESVTALAHDLGCSGVELNDGVSGVKEEGHCQLSGERMTVYIWPDGVDAKEPPGASSPFGGGWVVVGKNWTVAALTAAGAKKVLDKLGGELK